MFEDLWGSLTEAVSETWDVVYDASEAALKEAIQGSKESGKDTNMIRASEPQKGKNSDGSPILVDNRDARSTKYQLVNDVSNEMIYAGGAVAFLLLGLLMIKAVR